MVVFVVRDSNITSVSMCATLKTYVPTIPSSVYYVYNTFEINNIHRLGKKTKKMSEKSIERNRSFNAPKVYRIVIHLRSCIFESHVFNSEPITVLSFECFG